MPLSPEAVRARINLRVCEMRLRGAWIRAGSHHSWDWESLLASTEVRPRGDGWRLPWPPVEQTISNTRAKFSGRV